MNKNKKRSGNGMVQSLSEPSDPCWSFLSGPCVTWFHSFSRAQELENKGRAYVAHAFLYGSVVQQHTDCMCPGRNWRPGWLISLSERREPDLMPQATTSVVDGGFGLLPICHADRMD